MGRVIALDIGGKRTGIAVTDPLQIIATGLTTIATTELLAYLKRYFTEEKVDTIVIGEARNMDYTESESMPIIHAAAKKITEAFPGMPMVFVDERFTSKMAMQSMKAAGAGKKQMMQKATVDMVSATIILQTFLEKKIL